MTDLEKLEKIPLAPEWVRCGAAEYPYTLPVGTCLSEMVCWYRLSECPLEKHVVLWTSGNINFYAGDDQDESTFAVTEILELVDTIRGKR